MWLSLAEKEGLELAEIGSYALPAGASQYLYALPIQDFLERKFYWMSMRIDRFAVVRVKFRQSTRKRRTLGSAAQTSGRQSGSWPIRGFWKHTEGAAPLWPQISHWEASWTSVHWSAKRSASGICLRRVCCTSPMLRRWPVGGHLTKKRRKSASRGRSSQA